MQHRAERLVSVAFRCLFVMAVAMLFMTAVGVLRGFSDDFGRPISATAYFVRLGVVVPLILQTSLLLLSVAGTALTCSPWLLRRVPLAAREVLLVCFVAFIMIAAVLGDGYYIAKWFDADPSDPNYSHSDSVILLTLMICLTASNLILPVRWCVLFHWSRSVCCCT